MGQSPPRGRERKAGKSRRRAGMMRELGGGSERYIFFTAVKRSSGRRAWFGEAKVLRRVYEQSDAVGRQ